MDYETYYVLIDGDKRKTFKNGNGVIGDAKTRAYKAYQKAINEKPVYALYKYVYLYRGSIGCLEQLIEVKTVSSNL
jgi:hypothetical protein